MSRRLMTIVTALCLAALTVGAAIAVGQSGDQQARRNALYAFLSGSNEIGENGRRGAGDSDGRGTATVLLAGSKVCFGVTVARLSGAVAAHIHRGTSTRNGPVVVDFKLTPTAGNPGAASGCVDAAASLIAQIRRNPNRFYANVHNADFAGGAVRGQLGRGS